MTKTLDILVIEETKKGTGIKCSMSADGSYPFFLPKSQIKPYGPVRKGQFAKFDIPNWLWVQHWQLCGRVEFEAEKARKQENERRA